MFRGLTKQFASLGALAEQRLAGSGASLAPQCSASALQWLRPAAAAHQASHFSTDQFKKHVHNAGPHSLEFQRQPPEEIAQEAHRGFAVKALLLLGGFYSKESRHMRAASRLYTAVTEQAVSPRFLEAMGIPDDFQPLHSSLCLHIWLLLVRLRAEGKDGKQLAQLLYDDFQTDVEDRARKAGVKIRLQKQLTELEKQFYGSSMAYDKAMQGQETLDQALLRNVYLLDESKGEEALLLARYIRRELACLTHTPSEAIMAGNVKFSAEGLQLEGQEAASEAGGQEAAAAAAGGDGKQAMAAAAAAVDTSA